MSFFPFSFPPFFPFPLSTSFSVAPAFPFPSSPPFPWPTPFACAPFPVFGASVSARTGSPWGGPFDDGFRNFDGGPACSSGRWRPCRGAHSLLGTPATRVSTTVSIAPGATAESIPRAAADDRGFPDGAEAEAPTTLDPATDATARAPAPARATPAPNIFTSSHAPPTGAVGGG